MTPGAWLRFALAVPMAVATVEAKRFEPGQGSEGAEGDAIAFDIAVKPAGGNSTVATS